MEKSLIDQMILVFKIVATLGFVAFGVMTIGIIYKLFAKHYPPAVTDKKWVFIITSIFVIIILFFIYFVLF